MRRLIWAVLAVAGLWGGYWFAGATALERAVQGWLAAGAPRVAAAGADVAGFPNRFDLTLTGLRAGAAGEVVWEAPFVQLFALSWKPWHLIAAFPPEQTVTLPDGTVVALAAEKLQASLVVAPARALTLDRATMVGSGISVRAGGGPGVAVQDLRLASRQDPSRADTHEIGVQITGGRPDPALFAIATDRPLPQGDASLQLDAFLGFTAPIDRFAGETRPMPKLVEVRQARFAWGDILIEASGRLTPDAAGLAEGQIDLRLSGWDSALAVAVAAGWMRPEIAPTWAEVGRRMAEATATPDRIDLALVMEGGRMRLGPLPLGPAPRLMP